MQQSTCGELRTSVLGFGCGSAMGRVGRGASLRAMGAAWSAGITLFDTARSYGFGEAEAVLGEFLRGKRQQAVVATKFGISPQKLGTLKRMALPVARAAKQLNVPGLRSAARHGNNHPPLVGSFTVEGLRASLDESLKQLRTDYVDILFLHEASMGSMHQQDLMADLDALVQAGKVLRVGLYASAEVIAEVIMNGPPTLGAMQFGADLFDPTVSAFHERNQRGLLLIANHPFGSALRVARMKAVLAVMTADETVPRELRDKLHEGDWPVLLEAIFGVILKGMGAHALVFSMMRADHLRDNVRAVESNRFSYEDVALIQNRLLNELTA